MIIPRDQAAQKFAVSTRLLVRYEARGLVQAVREGEVEGYGPAEIRRLWTVVSLHRELGINLAGVEAILHLRAQVDGLHRQLLGLADRLRDALEAERDADEAP